MRVECQAITTRYFIFISEAKIAYIRRTKYHSSFHISQPFIIGAVECPMQLCSPGTENEIFHMICEKNKNYFRKISKVCSKYACTSTRRP